ncbi:MAG: hypothetical protein COZ69_09855, partial [Deltaproteobacteria bacterium CG_4_8_14_3_um_filter_45_9]
LHTELYYYKSDILSSIFSPKSKIYPTEGLRKHNQRTLSIFSHLLRAYTEALKQKQKWQK